MSVSQEQARELLDQYGDVLQVLSNSVQALGGMIPDAKNNTGAILNEQIPSVILEALEAIAYQRTFRPNLLERPGSSGLEKHALVKGCFGKKPDPNVCLRKVFTNMDTPLYASRFRTLKDVFLQDENKTQVEAFHKDISALTFIAEAPEGPVNLAVLGQLTRTLSDKSLGVYFKALQELIHYVSSDAEKERMGEDLNAFKEIKKSMLACVHAIKAMHESGQVDKKEIRKRIKILGKNIDDMLAYVDKTHHLTLEGQGNTKPNQALGERGLGEVFTYNLACLFRLLFMILSVGYFKSENPLAKKMGCGAFFVRTAKTVDEEKDIQTQQESLEGLGKQLTQTQAELNGLAREVALLRPTPAPSK